MTLFNIYIKKSSGKIIDDLVVIKNGFSVFACLLNILWFLQHKMWRESLALVLVSTILGFVAQKNWFGSCDMTIIEFGLITMLGLNAHYWYEQSLLRRDYQFSGCAYAANEDEAKLIFISGYFNNEDKSNIFPFRNL